MPLYHGFDTLRFEVARIRMQLESARLLVYRAADNAADNAADYELLGTSDTTTTFQVYKYDSLAPAKNTCTLQSGASADTFSMTNWGKANNGAYLSGVRFAANKDMTPLTNVLQ